MADMLIQTYLIIYIVVIMKKYFIFSAIAACGFMLTGCGSSSNVLQNVGQALAGMNQNGGAAVENTQQQTGSNTESLLGNLLGNLLGTSATLSEESLLGTWKYTSSDCVFESENLLAQAGGAVASKKLEEQLNTHLAKIGVKQGACSFTFNDDKTYTAIIGGRTISGNYTLDVKNKTLKMTYLGGLGSMTPQVVMKNGKLSLLFESDKLLGIVKKVAAIGNSTTLKAMSALLGNYEGMYIGIQLEK